MACPAFHPSYKIQIFFKRLILYLMCIANLGAIVGHVALVSLVTLTFLCFAVDPPKHNLLTGYYLFSNFVMNLFPIRSTTK